MIRIKWMIGHQVWWKDFRTDAQAFALVDRLRHVGFKEKSKSGVTINWPPQMITKITKRVLRESDFLTVILNGKQDTSISPPQAR